MHPQLTSTHRQMNHLSQSSIMHIFRRKRILLFRSLLRSRPRPNPVRGLPLGSHREAPDSHRQHDASSYKTQPHLISPDPELNSGGQHSRPALTNIHYPLNPPQASNCPCKSPATPSSSPAVAPA